MRVVNLPFPFTVRRFKLGKIYRHTFLPSDFLATSLPASPAAMPTRRSAHKRQSNAKMLRPLPKRKALLRCVAVARPTFLTYLLT